MKKFISLILAAALMTGLPNSAEASVTYVTDAGGCAYDECRTCVNLAPAIALSTVVIVAIIALGVQNSHSSHSCGSFSSHSSSCSCSSSSSSSTCSSSSSSSR